MCIPPRQRCPSPTILNFWAAKKVSVPGGGLVHARIAMAISLVPTACALQGFASTPSRARTPHKSVKRNTGSMARDDLWSRSSPRQLSALPLFASVCWLRVSPSGVENLSSTLAEPGGPRQRDPIRMVCGAGSDSKRFGGRCCQPCCRDQRPSEVAEQTVRCGQIPSRLLRAHFSPSWLPPAVGFQALMLMMMAITPSVNALSRSAFIEPPSAT
jgi:hypothetical protein